MGSSKRVSEPYSGFSEASKARITLAQAIIDSMPDRISSEAAVVGSSSWGVADENSDLDLDF